MTGHFRGGMRLSTSVQVSGHAQVGSSKRAQSQLAAADLVSFRESRREATDRRPGPGLVHAIRTGRTRIAGRRVEPALGKGRRWRRPGSSRAIPAKPGATSAVLREQWI
jgi:hypothetical protein